MNKAKFLYIFLSFLFASVVLQACKDDDLLISSPAETLPGADEDFSIDLAVTLDNMGGSRGDYGYNPMEDIENYINPEKFRVLFFDDQENFLFESKSRWVKRLGVLEDHTSWLVSVPFYTSGNDTGDYEWDWDDIREKITKRKFKVAILVNRPDFECFPDLDGMFEGVSKRFDNSGPNWKKTDSGKRKLIDLHHCQWDPIYTSKSSKNRKVSSGEEGFYDYVMGRVEGETNYMYKLTMGATSCWVDHGADLEDTGTKVFAHRCWRLPSQEYPIPMYGIQEFDPITNWVKGTPFNLSNLVEGDKTNTSYNHRSISLLRSVVKVELVIPGTYAKPTYVSIRYANVYARCEPMNIWQPTNEIWVDETKHDTECEWINIQKYGALVRKGDDSTAHGTSSSNDNSWKVFRERIAWFFGEWAENGPDGKPRFDFNNGSGNMSAAKVKSLAAAAGLPSPKVFNVCTQRNQIVMCDFCDVSSMYKDGNHHIVVYMGERNVSHPSDLWDVGNVTGSGKNTIAYWLFNVGNRAYSIPIGKFQGTSYIQDQAYTNGAEPSGNMGDYERAIIDRWNDTDFIPVPLVRNHVYRTTIGKVGTSRSGEPLGDLPVSSSMHASPSINFDTPKK